MQLSLLPDPPALSPLGLAVLDACPADDFHQLFEFVRVRLPSAEATEIDSEARRLGVERGEPGRIHYERSDR